MNYYSAVITGNIIIQVAVTVQVITHSNSAEGYAPIAG